MWFKFLMVAVSGALFFQAPAMQLFDAILRQDTAEVEQFLRCAGTKVNTWDDHGNTAVYFAVLKNNMEILRMLLAVPQINVNGKLGLIPLHAAVRLGNTKMVEALLQARADPNLRDYEDNTPLKIAENYGHADIERMLTKYAQ